MIFCVICTHVVIQKSNKSLKQFSSCMFSYMVLSREQTKDLYRLYLHTAIFGVFVTRSIYFKESVLKLL